MTTQLNAANLTLLDQNIQVPKYDRQKVGQSIMHVGVGGFHRAHQALYMDDLLHQGGDSHWGYCGVGLLKHDARIRDVKTRNAEDRHIVRRILCFSILQQAREARFCGRQ